MMLISSAHKAQEKIDLANETRLQCSNLQLMIQQVGNTTFTKSVKYDTVELSITVTSLDVRCDRCKICLFKDVVKCLQHDSLVLWLN